MMPPAASPNPRGTSHKHKGQGNNAVGFPAGVKEKSQDTFQSQSAALSRRGKLTSLFGCGGFDQFPNALAHRFISLVCQNALKYRFRESSILPDGQPRLLPNSWRRIAEHFDLALHGFFHLRRD